MLLLDSTPWKRVLKKLTASRSLPEAKDGKPYDRMSRPMTRCDVSDATYEGHVTRDHIEAIFLS
jgi:hypothetical protein